MTSLATRIRWIMVAALLIGCPAVSAQADDTQTAASPHRFSMDFRDADIGDVLRAFAAGTHWQVVAANGLTGPVTIIAPKPVTAKRALELLQAALEDRGFVGQVEQHGAVTIMQIVPIGSAVADAPIVTPGDATANPPGDEVVSRVIPLKNTNAAQMARVLSPLVNKGASIIGATGANALVVTDTESNTRRIKQLAEALDGSGGTDSIRTFMLKYADSTTVAGILNSMFTQVSPATFAKGRRGKPKFQKITTITAVPDVRTNSISVAGSGPELDAVAGIIARLDDPGADARLTKTVKLKYADAIDTADTINTVLSGLVAQPGGRPMAARSFQRPIRPGFQGGVRSQSVSSTDPFSDIVADQRTNTLLITATAARMKLIDNLVAALDVKVESDTTAFVVPINHGSADDLAQALLQAFGTSSYRGGSARPNTNRQTNTRNSRTNNRRNTGPSLLR